MFTLIFGAVILAYIILGILVLYGMHREFPKLQEKDLPDASVLVAARNEEPLIRQCMESLHRLEYPEGKLEIILINDHSTDRTGEIIDEFIKDKPRFKVVHNPPKLEGLRGKSNALANALKVAVGKVILTTDADCTVQPGWARTHCSYYTEGVANVNGYTAQKAESMFGGLQHLDFMFLLGIGAGVQNIGMPISCIGNNMTYLRKAYDEAGGYEALSFSVTEDSQLLHAINDLGKYKLPFPFEPEGLVMSEPVDDLSTLYRQKKRWGVGGLDVPPKSFIVMGTGFLANLGIVLSPFFAFGWLSLLLVGLKLLVDAVILTVILKRFSMLATLKYFFAFEVYYIVYSIVLPFVVAAGREVQWKERKF